LITGRKFISNQQNAQKSTGPRTAEGKAISSKNALKHGLRTLALLPTEDHASYQELADCYYGHFDPVGPVETSFVEELIRCDWWRRGRVLRAETEIIEYAGKKSRQTSRPTASKQALLKLRNATAARATDGEGQNETIGQGEKPITPWPEESGDEQFLPAFNDDTADAALQRLQRYAGIYDGKYFRALHELARLQAARRGQKVAPPVALDLTVSGSAKEVI
jgi:uncharacterized protein with von Willebrand factor type A (vWA) domain